MEDHKRKNQQQLAPSETEPTEPSGFNYDVLNVRQTPQTTCSTATQQSDHQLIFGATSLNISTITTDVLNTSSDQEMRRQRPISDLQSELERRAQERRENLERNEHEFLSVPPYTSQGSYTTCYVKNDLSVIITKFKLQMRPYPVMIK